MLNDDGALFETLAAWRAAGHRCALATVIDTWGSAPRSRGSHLVVRGDGLFEGSVSGGCVEGDVIATALDTVIPHDRPTLREYGVPDADAWEVGLACGGRIRILIQPVAPEGFPDDLVLSVRQAGRSRNRICITTLLPDGRSHAGSDMAGDAFIREYRPALRLAVIGAVHIAQALIPMARMAGYAPFLVDPRAAFARNERFADVRIDDRWPDEALEDWRPDRSSAVVTLTHDPKLDDPALARALRSDCFYIAALGSSRTHARRLERLSEQGFSELDLKRIHGPAGLRIGAANPAEIAISIIAQMTAVLRGIPE